MAAAGMDAPPRRTKTAHLVDALTWGGLRPGTGVALGPPLFPRDVN
jgi:hypothetical protein